MYYGSSRKQFKGRSGGKIRINENKGKKTWNQLQREKREREKKQAQQAQIFAPVVVNTALNQQGGKTQSQGMRQGKTTQAETAAVIKQLKKDRVTSSASTQTPKPKTIPQVLQKMEANQVTPALPKVVVAASPTVIREIKKGADPIQAYRALKSEPAIILANCKEMFSQIPASQQRSWGMVQKSYSKELGKIKLTEQQILMLDKEVRILALQNSPDVLLKAQSALGAAQTQQATDIAVLSDKASQYAAKRGIHHDLIGCLIATARAEGALAFEASIGSEIKTPEQELEEEQMKTPEEIVEETEGAAILLQAAEEDADATDPSIAETPSDKAVAPTSKGMNYEEYLTPKNLLLGGLALGAIYMVFIKD